MGKRGPKKTPTRILKLRGSWLADTREDEPKLESDIPNCPVWVKGIARRKYKELTKLLNTMGVLTKIDRNALARYCDTWAWWREAREFIKKNGMVYVTYTGGDGNEKKIKYIQQFPQVNIANKLAAQLGRLEAEFGLTPSARAGMTINKKDTMNTKTRFFSNTG